MVTGSHKTIRVIHNSSTKVTFNHSNTRLSLSPGFLNLVQIHTWIKFWAWPLNSLTLWDFLFTKALNPQKCLCNQAEQTRILWRNSKPFPTVWCNSHSSPSLSVSFSPSSFFSSQLITHHCKGHELQDASATSLLQALNTLLHKTLYKLGVRACHLGAQDGGNEEEKVGWGVENRWYELSWLK